MNKKFLPFALPDIGEEEINEVVDSLKSGWITTGPKTKRFEEEFAKYIGTKHAIAVNSATAGLHLALDALGISRGDKVITSTYTFTATAEVIRYFDADPIFCDIKEDTFNIDVDKLEKLIIEHKPKVVIPVHIAGQSADMDRILKLKEKYHFKILEDAAHALPTTHNGRLIGSIGDITVFSFYATKTLATGEGGMITTDNDDYKARMSIMRLHGLNRDAWDRYTSNKSSWFYEIVAPGYKYNMTDIASAMGIHQLKKIDKFFERRNQIAKEYDQAFSNNPKIKIPFIINKSDKHAYHLYIIQIDEKKRDQFIETMREKNIGCSVHFIPLHMHPYWKTTYHLKEEDFPVATRTYKSAVSLPLYTKMTDEDVKNVIQAVNESL